jgi:hypothetical protein
LAYQDLGDDATARAQYGFALALAVAAGIRVDA